MGNSTFRYVICYDVTDDRRRRRLADCLDGYGDRVQYSVFEGVLERSLYEELLNDVRAIIDEADDGVLIYAICGSCSKRRTAIGQSETEELPGSEIVFIV